MCDIILIAQLQAAGIDLPPQELVGKKFRFGDGRDEVVGTITGLSSSDDGLPFLEVSNKRFAGLEIKGILLDGVASLITTAQEDAYRYFPGNLVFFP